MPGLGGAVYTATTDAAAVAASAQVGDDSMAKVEDITEKLKAENLALHGRLIAKKLVFVRRLLNNIYLKKDVKEMVEKKEGTARLLTVEPIKRKNTDVLGQLKKDVLTVTMKAREQTGTLTASLKQSQREADALRKKEATVTQELENLCGGMERAEYEPDGFKAKLQRAKRKREKFVDAVILVRSSADKPQEYAKKKRLG